jgi:hypothetical protein
VFSFHALAGFDFSLNAAFRGGCCFEEVQIIQEQCETGLQDWECSHSRCFCWYASYFWLFLPLLIFVS